MGRTFDSIPSSMFKFIAAQKVFWVATAPLGEDGLVNVSPKGVDGSFHIVNENQVWFEDLTGSGVATVAHVRENRRITIMFNAFEGSPNILRLYGKGTIHEFGTPEYEEYLPPGVRQHGSRAVVVIDVFKVTTSCGFGVPYYDYVGPRTRLITMSKVMETSDALFNTGLRYWWKTQNAVSIDGLPGLLVAPDSKQKFVSPNPDRQLDGGLDENGARKAKAAREGKVEEKRMLGVRADELKLFAAFFIGMAIGIGYTARLRQFSQ